MHNNFNNLTKEFELLKKKIDLLPPISQISSKKLLKYHSLVSKKELLELQISKLLESKDHIIKDYTTNNENWLYNDTINCRKYCRLEKKASYTRDKKLYKLGFLNSKPTPPLLQNLKQFTNTTILEPLTEHFVPKFSSLKNKISSRINNSPISKIRNFFKNIFPTKFTHLAIEGTKKCILGYRAISDSLDFSIKNFSRNVSSAPVIQFLAYVNSQAKKEADLQSNSFKSRIQVTLPTSHSYYSASSKNPTRQTDLDLSL